MNRILVIEYGSVRVVRAPGDSGVFSFLEFNDSESVVNQLRMFQGDPRAMFHMRSLLAEDVSGVHELTDHQVIEQLTARVIQRKYGLAEALERRIVLPTVEEPAQAEPVVAPSTPRQKTWVEFDFVYPDGTAVGGLDYVLEDPDSIQESGKTGDDDGKIRRDEIPEGNWTAILRDVQSVSWSSQRIKCDESVTIKGKLSGYTYGTKAKVNIYRELKESKAEIIESLDARVENDAISVQWKYKYTATPQHKAESGVARFIAELEVDGGKHWAKTITPLEVELKSIKRVAWSSGKVHSGGGFDLIIETLGYAAGTSAKLELWTVDPFGEINKSADLSAVKLSGSKAQVRGFYGSGAGAIAIKAPGEFFVVVKIDEKSARSDLIWCVEEELAGETNLQAVA